VIGLGPVTHVRRCPPLRDQPVVQLDDDHRSLFEPFKIIREQLVLAALDICFDDEQINVVRLTIENLSDLHAFYDRTVVHHHPSEARF
jgi:hypothetical protein